MNRAGTSKTTTCPLRSSGSFFRSHDAAANLIAAVSPTTRFLLPITISAASLFAQNNASSTRSEKFNHVHWTLTLDRTFATPGGLALARLEAVVDNEWHMYSLTTPLGPIPTSIDAKGNSLIEELTIYEPPPDRKFDPTFNSETETYEGKKVFLAPIRLRKDIQPGPVTLAFVARYQTCSGTQCIPPREQTITGGLNIVASAPSLAVTIPADYIEAKPGSLANSAPIAKPVITAALTQDDLGTFLALAFGFGLAAIFTPCVFPMIPITMSYLDRPKGRLGSGHGLLLGDNRAI